VFDVCIIDNSTHEVGIPVLSIHCSEGNFPLTQTTCFTELYVLKFQNYFYITVALHVSTDMVIIMCFEITVEIAALPSISSNPMNTLVYAPHVLWFYGAG
jgi:hypothetical protein